MDDERKALLLRWSRAAAASGDHVSWQDVEASLLERGHADAREFFSDAEMQRDIDETCAQARKRKE